MSAMKRMRTLFDFNFGKVRDRGMIKTKYRDKMRTTQDARKKFLFSSWNFNKLWKRYVSDEWRAYLSREWIDHVTYERVSDWELRTERN